MPVHIMITIAQVTPILDTLGPFTPTHQMRVDYQYCPRLPLTGHMAHGLVETPTLQAMRLMLNH